MTKHISAAWTVAWNHDRKTDQFENDIIIINLIIEMNVTSVPPVNGTDDN